jgi:hypothetical protein
MLPGKAEPPCSCTHYCAACTATCEQYALASANATGASGHVVGQAPGSRAGRQVRAVGDAAKGGLKPVLRGRGHAEAAQGLPGLVLLDPGLLPAGHLAGQLDKPGSLFRLTGLDRRLAPARTLDEALDAVMTARRPPG